MRLGVSVSRKSGPVAEDWRERRQMSATVGLEQIVSLRRVYSRVPSLFFAFLDSSLDGESNGVLPASKLAEERAGYVFLQFD